jgi:hypothetical protein
MELCPLNNAKIKKLGRKPFEAEDHINKNSSINSGLTSKKIIFLAEKQIPTEITIVCRKNRQV